MTCAEPCREGGSITCKLIAHDCVQLSHDVHAALYGIIERGGCRHLRFVFLYLLIDGLLKRFYIGCKVFKKIIRQAAPREFQFEGQGVCRESSCHYEQRLI